jgi:hypothetical protein
MCPEATVISATDCTNTSKVAAANQTACTTYFNTDYKAVSQAYYYYNNVPTAVQSDVTQAMIAAARKADATGATRKYIKTVCPDFYKTGDATAGTVTDPGANYGSWTSASGTTNGFDPSRITAANVKTWLMYAGSAFDTNGNATSGYTISGQTSKWNYTDANGVANWKLAMNAGPGTMPQPTWGTTAPASR